VLARLLAQSQDGNEIVRSRAAYVLGRLGAAAATPEVLARMILMVKNAPGYIGISLAWACGQAGDKLKEENLAALVRFWRKHLASNKWGLLCGEYQELSSAAYKQLKHLAGLGAALPPIAPRQQRRKTASPPRPRKTRRKA
jgi:hypothetical protein